MSEKKTTVNQDPVSQQKIWTEHLIKEAKLQKISTQFSLNPISLRYITKKATQIVPSKNKNALTNYPLLSTHKNNKDMQFLRRSIQNMKLTPTQKYKYPISTSMDYGWFVNNKKYSIKQAKFIGDKQANDNNNKQRWHYALSQTDITRFAQHYYLTMGTHYIQNQKMFIILMLR